MGEVSWRGSLGSVGGTSSCKPVSKCEAREGWVTCMVLKDLSGGPKVERDKEEEGWETG